jgi:ABC-type cobalt transport system substrate-binding protein
MSRSKLSAMLVCGFVAAVGGAWLWLVRGLAASSEWPGVDESVIGSIAERAGRPETEPLVSWVQGDLLLFMFLCAGLIAGFVIGYFARIAFVEQREPASKQLDERAA